MVKFCDKEDSLRDLFNIEKPVIGMIHLHPLPGAPGYKGDGMERIIELAVEEAKILERGGVDGLQVENMWDLPYHKPENIGVETVASMAVAACKVRDAVSIPIGINCHINGVIQSLAIAVAVEAKWIRAFEWTNAYIANPGYVEGAAPKALRYRSFLKSDHIKIMADVHVKHGSHFLISDRAITEQAHDVEFFGADALIITGSSTGTSPGIEELKEIKKKVSIPVIIGSGLKVENVAQFFKYTDGAIVGSYFKRDGVWWNPVDEERVRKLMREVKEIRKGL